MIYIVLWLTLAAFVGMYASKKGRSGFGFFLLALIISPLISFVIALVLSPIDLEAKAISSGDVKKCPICAELVKAEAKICKHCSNSLIQDTSEPQKHKQETKNNPINQSLGLGE